jgi:L-fucose isomerase-like protein
MKHKLGVEVAPVESREFLTEQMLALRGEIVDCRDTTSCRTTVTVKISDAREFIRKALGNHHVMVYGDYTGDIRALSQALGMNLTEL